jgi:peroxiredoxin family protein
MQQTIKNNGVATIEELRGLSQEADVKFIACQMTVELFGFSHDDFIPGVDYAGAATFLPVAQQADVSLVHVSPMTLVKLCNILKLIDSREASPCN